MPRRPRLQIPGGAYHVTARGVAGLPLFRGDHDRSFFLDVLAEVVNRRGWSCHAFCLMTTHYHLLVRTPEGDLASGMQRLNAHYAQEFNRRHGGRGHVFERRYSSTVIEREGHLIELCRYLALNPVRARICSSPADWPWSSYRAFLGLAPRPSYLAVEWLLANFGADPDRARQRFRAFVHDLDVTQTCYGV